MEKYNYYKAVEEDVRNYIEEHVDNLHNEYTDADDAKEKLNGKMWVSDSVTGNASGSYTFNTWQAEEYLCHNLDLLEEACSEFGSNMDILKSSAESCDVTIRCYLLSQTVSEVVDELWEEEDEEQQNGAVSE